MTNQEIESRVEDLLSESEEDFSAAEAFIDEHSGDYDGDLAEYAFRRAVQMGLYDYVSDHIDDVELNDEDGGCYSSYLYETDDDSIIELLMDSGASKNLEDYDGCRFAVETVNGTVLSFDSDFQREVFETYLDNYDLTREQVAECLKSGENPESESFDRDLEEDMDLLGVSVKDGELDFEDLSGEYGWQTVDLLNELGYDCEFDGYSWKLETVGVYYIE